MRKENVVLTVSSLLWLVSEFSGLLVLLLQQMEGIKQFQLNW